MQCNVVFKVFCAFFPCADCTRYVFVNGFAVYCMIAIIGCIFKLFFANIANKIRHELHHKDKIVP